MAPDEYSTGGGGKLKLKGSKVSDGRVDKKKKKKAKKEKEKETDAEQAEAEKSQRQESREADSAERAVSRERDEDGGSGSSAAKTEAERKYEEIRRKRLHERLQKEGIKSHKERVEELNKYLSRLSEHHDMPKIGPG
ncbi:uncharacterized protein N7473_009971 [Penicillium subrubescens]|jgi:protein FAM32A|uniref:DUF1754-domain-containing protein n=1 Tax=Penicillium subrubescens TaxID=1316194 RepID=A0A1Q5U1Y0_9EURO|nr:uncharacterized protein N7473_009971 [Penicillium subrubescens]KAJ5883085.1 hypothetical protein N7473_009971 [Penicillium subrubescens]OKP06457.1 hypothetical protein PENSUB_6447 [Penicillium subrubescens]